VHVYRTRACRTGSFSPENGEKTSSNNCCRHLI
jgi:hypothetical protein